MKEKHNDTIVAIATPPGRGGIGVIRVSGPLAYDVGRQISQRHELTTRYAHYGPLHANKNEIIDAGITIYFPAPNSFTGEEVVEFQGHGSPIVLDQLLSIIHKLGVRLAEPGEFTKRAFLNEKMDLTQAEAVCDLINAESKAAARCAMSSLRGGFSEEIRRFLYELISLRTYLEAANDFPEDEIDILEEGNVDARLSELNEHLAKICQEAQRGVAIQEGISVSIVGQPNAGKSSLFNSLVGIDSAIVTDVPGTTRDLIKERVSVAGWTLDLIDTAGIREHAGDIEKEGIKRALKTLETADHLLCVVDALEYACPDARAAHVYELLGDRVLEPAKVTVILNKTDLLDEKAKAMKGPWVELSVSAKHREGIEVLQAHLQELFKVNTTTEGTFTARRRHLDAIARAQQAIEAGMDQLVNFRAIELLAEDLRVAQKALSEITGAFTTEDLLGEIFSTFCIGK